jgi:hypothetical protein
MAKGKYKGIDVLVEFVYADEIICILLSQQPDKTDCEWLPCRSKPGWYFKPEFTKNVQIL